MEAVRIAWCPLFVPLVFVLLSKYLGNNNTDRALHFAAKSSKSASASGALSHPGLSIQRHKETAGRCNFKDALTCKSGSVRRLSATNTTHALFMSMWKRDWSGHPHLKNPPSFSNRLKIVIAIPTPRFQCHLRNTHRKTWMTYPYVCPLQDRDKPGCHVFPVFLFANVAADDIEQCDDSIILNNVPEAANAKKNKFGVVKSTWAEGNAKTPTWLRMAFRNMTWATHIAKQDMDTFAYWPLILKDLDESPQENIFYGRRISRGGFMGKGGMFGEFYVMTPDVMKCFDTFLYRYPWGFRPEDQILGALVWWRNFSGCGPQVKWVASRRWHHVR